MSKKTSPSKLKANRKNSKKSTGPKTPDGKKRVARNALKHGLLARFAVIPHGEFPEDQEAFDSLLQELREDLHVVGVVEEVQVEMMAVAYWCMGRVAKLESARRIEEWFLRREELDRDKEMFNVFVKTYMGSNEYHDLDARSAIAQDPLLQVLCRAKEEIETRGRILEMTLAFISLFMDDDNHSFAGFVKGICRVAKGHEDGKLSVSREESNVPCPEKCKRGLLDVINLLIARRENTLKCMDDLPELQNRIRFRVMCPPTDDLSEKYPRYYTMYERRWYKAMHELERLQLRRQGDVVPPPLKVDATHDT